MPAKILIAEQRAASYYVQVQIDTTRVDGQGNPDPAFVREYHFGLDVPAGMTLIQYRTNMLVQIKAMVADELARAASATTVASLQGQTW